MSKSMQQVRTATWSLAQVCNFIARLKMKGYKVMDFGRDGWACELDGHQLFRATNTGAERYAVKWDGGVFADV